MSVFTASESDSILEYVKGNLDLSCQFFGTTWHELLAFNRARSTE